MQRIPPAPQTCQTLTHRLLQLPFRCEALGFEVGIARHVDRAGVEPEFSALEVQRGLLRQQYNKLMYSIHSLDFVPTGVQLNDPLGQRCGKYSIRAKGTHDF